MSTPRALTDDRHAPQENLRHVLQENITVFRAFAQSRLGDAEIAADVVQDALLKALRAEAGLTDDAHLVAWFYRILRNAITDLHRRRASQAAALERLALEPDDAQDGEAHQLICGCLMRLLPTLKPEYAEVLRRLDLEEHDGAAVAHSLGITAGNLKVRLHRARQQLKERLVENCRLCATHGCLDCQCESQP